MIWCRSLDCLAHRNDAVAVQEWLYVSKFQTGMRFAGDWQNFICPHFGITIDRDIRGHLPFARFTRRHFVDQALFQRFILRLQLFLSQRYGRLEKTPVYNVCIPKSVECLLTNTSATWL